MKNNCQSFLLFLILSLVLLPSPVNAGVMSNSYYRIQLDNVAGSGILRDADYNLRTSLDDISLDSFTPSQKTSEKNNLLDISPLTPLAIHFTSLIVDFGKLTPTNPVIRSLNVSISHNKFRGYSVVAFQDKPLFSQQINSFIPNTSCDSGTCTPSESALWKNTLTYGSGYRCTNKTGSDCVYGFSQENFFKPFANRHENENPQVIMRSSFSLKNKKDQPEGEITYKVNIPGTQPQAGYINTVTIIAVPYF